MGRHRRTFRSAGGWRFLLRKSPVNRSTRNTRQAGNRLTRSRFSGRPQGSLPNRVPQRGAKISPEISDPPAAVAWRGVLDYSGSSYDGPVGKRNLAQTRLGTLEFDPHGAMDHCRLPGRSDGNTEDKKRSPRESKKTASRVRQNGSYFSAQHFLSCSSFGAAETTTGCCPLRQEISYSTTAKLTRKLISPMVGWVVFSRMRPALSVDARRCTSGACLGTMTLMGNLTTVG